MKIFIEKILISTFIILIVFGIPFAVNRSIICKAVEKGWILPDSILILITGDSHAQFSLDPSLIKYSTNVGIANQYFEYSEDKIKLLIENAPNIDLLILTFSYFNLSEIAGKKSTYTSKLFAPMYHWEFCNYYDYDYSNIDRIDLLKEKLGVLDIFRLKRMFEVINTGKINYLGGFVFSEGSYLNHEICQKKLISHYSENFKDLSFATCFSVNKYLALKRIFEFCRLKGVKVVLYSTPLYEDYYSQISPLIISKMDSIANDLCRNYDSKFIDNSRLVIPDSCFLDHDHTNGRGARLSSLALKDSLIKYKLVKYE